MADLRLEELDILHTEAYLAMLEDGRRHDVQSLGWFSPESADLKTAAQFKKFVVARQKLKADWRPKGTAVSVTDYVMRGDQDGILACGRMQFPLTTGTEVDGGNLVCFVPPSLRRRGHGSYVLALMLFEAVRAGLRRVLVTAPEADVISRRLIERNRGVLQDVVKSNDPSRVGLPICRYWISFG